MSIALYETEIHDLLYQLTRSNNIDQVLQEIVELAKKSTSAEFSSLYLLENDKITHHLLTSSGDFPEVARYKIQQSMRDGMAGWVYRHKQGALASDVSIDDRWVAIDDSNPFGSVVVVPLMIQERIIAILTLGHSEKRFFREYHLAIAANYAERAAIIVENVRLTMRNKLLENSFKSCFSSIKQPFIITLDKEIRYANQPAMDELSLGQADTLLSDTVNGAKIAQFLDGLADDKNASAVTIEFAQGQSYQVNTSSLANLGLGLVFSKA